MRTTRPRLQHLVNRALESWAITRKRQDGVPSSPDKVEVPDLVRPEYGNEQSSPLSDMKAQQAFILGRRQQKPGAPKVMVLAEYDRDDTSWRIFVMVMSTDKTEAYGLRYENESFNRHDTDLQRLLLEQNTAITLWLIELLHQLDEPS